MTPSASLMDVLKTLQQTFSVIPDPNVIWEELR